MYSSCFSPVITDCNSFGFLMANAENSCEPRSGRHKVEKLSSGFQLQKTHSETFLSHQHSIPCMSRLWLMPQLLSHSQIPKSSWAASHEPYLGQKDPQMGMWLHAIVNKLQDLWKRIRYSPNGVHNACDLTVLILIGSGLENTAQY